MQSMFMADSFEEPDVNSPSHQERLRADSGLTKHEVAPGAEAEPAALAAGSNAADFSTPQGRSRQAFPSPPEAEEIFDDSDSIEEEEEPRKMKRPAKSTGHTEQPKSKAKGMKRPAKQNAAESKPEIEDVKAAASTKKDSNKSREDKKTDEKEMVQSSSSKGRGRGLKRPAAAPRSTEPAAEVAEDDAEAEAPVAEVKPKVGSTAEYSYKDTTGDWEAWRVNQTLGHLGQVSFDSVFH